MLEKFSFNKVNTAVAVGVSLPDATNKETLSSLNELKLLADTLGINVVHTFFQKRDKFESNYFIGKGKLQEIKDFIEENNVDAVLFDNELSGVQERNLEKFFDKCIFGRTEIILNIFNKRAKNKEAKLQVKLACLEYMMPRLRNRWDHFSRVEGGIGMRGGEGEKQLELDKRMIQRDILSIKRELKKVDVQMKNRRKKRTDKKIVSLVGYTNVGKSSLFNNLAKSDTFTENMLFATLESKIRRVYISDALTILLNDTVGFITKLPHSLVASFKSTLDEILNSSLVLHVIDATSDSIIKEVESVNSVLDEIGALDVPIIRVFNKIDLLDNGMFDCFVPKNENDVYISALKNIGIDTLKQRIEDFFNAKNS